MGNNKAIDQELFDAVYQAAGRAEVRDAVESIYSNLQREIDTRKPLCNSSGRCCRFEEFGHRLYITTIELATFVYALEMTATSPQTWDGTGCPFQINRLCSVHQIRPFGCRIFFCDETSTEWQQVAYERFHQQLKDLHQRFDIPYRYLEWRAALNGLGLTPYPV